MAAFRGIAISHCTRGHDHHRRRRRVDGRHRSDCTESTPRFHYFGDQQLNIFIAYSPFVWLPAVMVLAALGGHLVIFRAVRVRA